MTIKRPKNKGTGGERELRELLNEEGVVGLLRTSPGTAWDLVRIGDQPPLEVLATRPDRGRWLVTMDARRFADLVAAVADERYPELRIEVKRYARFSLHSIFESKFGRKA